VTEPGDRPARNSTTSWAWFGDEVLVYDRASGRSHRLNATAGAIWEAIDGSWSLDDLAAALHEETGTDEEELRAELVALVGSFADNQLIGAGPAPETSAAAPRRRYEPAIRAALDARAWAFESPTYVALDLRFAIRSDDVALGRYLASIFAPLAGEGPPDDWYSVIDRGSGCDRGRYPTYFGGIRLERSSKRRYVVSLVPWHVNQQVVRRSTRRLLFHAGAVEAAEGVIVITGPANAGKTTLTTALCRAGFAYVTDEVVALDPQTGLVQPFPKSVAFDPGSWPLFPDLEPPRPEGMADDDLVEKWHVGVSAFGHPMEAPAPLRAVFLTRHVAGGGTSAEPLDAIDTATVLLENGFNLGENHHDPVPTLARVLNGVVGHSLQSDGVDDAVELVRKLSRS
jgi:PqqD family protein of HPr-rel-A system